MWWRPDILTGNKLKPERHQSGSRDRNPTSGDDIAVSKLSHQPEHSAMKGYDQNRYKLHFLRESDEEIKQRKVEARKVIEKKYDVSWMPVCCFLLIVF